MGLYGSPQFDVPEKKEKCPVCGNKNEGTYCSRCGANKYSKDISEIPKTKTKKHLNLTLMPFGIGALLIGYFTLFFGFLVDSYITCFFGFSFAFGSPYYLILLIISSRKKKYRTLSFICFMLCIISFFAFSFPQIPDELIRIKNAF